MEFDCIEEGVAVTCHGGSRLGDLAVLDVAAYGHGALALAFALVGFIAVVAALGVGVNLGKTLGGGR